MLNKVFLFSLMLIVLTLSVSAKQIDQDVFARKSEVTAEVPAQDLLSLNGIRLSITSELENLKLDSKIFWEKLDAKKLSPKEELNELKPLFSELSVVQVVPNIEATAEKEQTPPRPMPKVDTGIRGRMKAELDDEKLKNFYDVLVSNLEETKLKTFYILADISIDSTMAWDDLGVGRAENFSGVIIDSWKKLAQKDFKNFESYSVLEKDFLKRPEFMNTKSVTLKWNSTFKKTFTDEQKKTASYELNAQYVLVNTKSGTVVTSFDFPVQKREISTLNKKSLSSTLASLVYNLLLSQSSKIQEALDSQGGVERTHLELKITGLSLSEVYGLNSLLQEKLKELKPVSSVKSFSAASSVIDLEAGASAEQILDMLSKGGNKFPLNEQKVLLFNRVDKSFAIIPKDSNN